MHKQAFCSRRYLVRKAEGACTLMYRYELQHSESVPVLHGEISTIRPLLYPRFVNTRKHFNGGLHP